MEYLLWRRGILYLHFLAIYFSFNVQFGEYLLLSLVWLEEGGEGRGAGSTAPNFPSFCKWRVVLYKGNWKSMPLQRGMLHVGLCNGAGNDLVQEFIAACKKK